MVVPSMKYTVVMIMVACTTMSVFISTTQATRDPLVSIRRPSPSPDSQFTNPYKWLGLGPSVGDKEVEKCWAPLDEIKGCHSQIITSLINEEIRLGEFCCEFGLPKVSDECWKKMFPLFPDYGSMLTRWCIIDP